MVSVGECGAGDGLEDQNGGGNRLSLNGAIKILENLAGRKAGISCSGAAKGDVKHTWSDISKAKRELGYSPKTKIAEGLKKEYEWIKNLRD